MSVVDWKKNAVIRIKTVKHPEESDEAYEKRKSYLLMLSRASSWYVTC